MKNRQFTSHQLAQMLLAKEDVPVAVGRAMGIYGLAEIDFRVSPDGELLFKSDEYVDGETTKKIVWITGSPLL